ncbi:hypothetical protein PC129_g207 [Phytophthora cactorum]|uniref:Uncharacterized protein n=1 Tax=Phytophthora cactorum TaxID=29920 RepID=A0A329RPT4_9STRA|nr:hypothetical protein GQ600_179 [Phytophthora cactorum]KAG2781389.1 hypothetical protein Pcac1_g8597 [Phytophthora cactorum]KAG2813201.1 hypothetical protein PC112_g14839 [Phytophthora cactorum]KAG2849334.1 hypothetical protein PC111_g10 [Phytophthora cactorum]KAG2869436.1 hypothetical protein PC113_g243 [Phytophthora cactorum]
MSDASRVQVVTKSMAIDLTPLNTRKEPLIRTDERHGYLAEGVAGRMIKIEVENQQSNAEIHRAAAEIPAKAIEVTRESDKSPIDDYTRLVEQIALNELAVKDSLNMIRNMAKTNDAEAMEHLKDIKELMDSIKKEKTRRDAKSAAILAQQWKESQGELDRLLLQPSGTELLDVPHGRLVEVFRTLERNGEEVVALQVKLKNRLRCLKAKDTDNSKSCWNYPARWKLNIC